MARDERCTPGEQSYCLCAPPLRETTSPRLTACYRGPALTLEQSDHLPAAISQDPADTAIWTAACQSCHDVGSTGVPSAHFKLPSKNAICSTATPNSLEKDADRVIAFNHGNSVGCFKRGHIQ